MQADETTYRRLYRDPANKMVAGVAAGIAEHLALATVVVRVAFVVLMAANGLGVLLYAAFWAFLPVDPKATPRPGRRRNRLQRLALAALALGVIVAQLQLQNFGINATLIALVALVAIGAGIIWRQADPGRTRRAELAARAAPAIPAVPATVAATAEVGDSDRRWFLLRLIGGGLLMIVGIIGILYFLAPIGESDVGATVTGLLFALLALAGLTLALAPVLFRVFGQLREERVARIREQERAEVAAVVHDQVLHTLALIQRNAGDSTSVLRLARGQERSLRGWLYKPTGSPRESFSAALEQAAAEVEDTYAITVDTVVVGDTANDEQVSAVVSAAREALVNAARHGKVGTVSVYAEAEPDQLSVYIRDRGAGFDMSTVDDDRHGVRGSIIGRMRRHGGQAEIRTAPGEGTEVELTMPRNRKSVGDSHESR
jgi:signal transduction histidine kinase